MTLLGRENRLGARDIEHDKMVDRLGLGELVEIAPDLGDRLLAGLGCTGLGPITHLLDGCPRA